MRECGKMEKNITDQENFGRKGMGCPDLSAVGFLN